ncbi:MAG: M28 family peptidase [Myxococcales bacterium]|nr:M28 family peptidase [Myxococcales bacterium]MCB9706096.1 M28 family peptidase [Myxococcales bacterium]
MRARSRGRCGALKGAAAALALALTGALGCAPAPAPALAYDPASLAFDGEAALARLQRFVAEFPDRDSGQPNNKRAADFIEGRLAGLGLTCERDAWTVVNHSRELALGNVVCRLPGASPRELVIVAHHDQSPETVEGADNDGSGITILLGLAEVFAREPGPRPLTLTFLAADAEEWGMLGSLRYLETRDDPKTIAAAISLDNLGKRFYDGLIVEPTGQFRGYGPLWLIRAAEAASRAAASAGAFAVDPRAPIQQVLDQAVPISFMDQGPFVAAGIPAIGFAGRVPAESMELHWQTYHAPGDTIELQSAASLGRAGRGAEATIRQLLGMAAAGELPQESGPYLYDPGDEAVLRGPALWAIFAAIVALFGVGSLAAGGWRPAQALAGWRRALPHVLALWLPLCASVLVLYGLVGAGLMLDFHLYPATPKDPEIFHPRWPAVVAYLAALAGMLALGRRLAARAQARDGAAAPSFGERKSLALALIAAASLYILLRSPFTLLFVVPTLAWIGVRGRCGLGRALDVVLLVVGGAILYLLIYFFGFVILRNGFGVLWYLMMMFGIGMVSLPSAIAVAAVLAGGAAIVVPPPGERA